MSKAETSIYFSLQIKARELPNANLPSINFELSSRPFPFHENFTKSHPDPRWSDVLYVAMGMRRQRHFLIKVTIRSVTGCAWDAKNLFITLPPSWLLDPTKIPWRPKLMGHQKFPRTFLQSIPNTCLLSGWACLFQGIGSCPKGPTPSTSSWWWNLSPINAEDTGLIPDPGGSHMMWSN